MATSLLHHVFALLVLLDSRRIEALGAARGVEQATLVAAQAREQLGDLWAEAREEVLAEVDGADFALAAGRAHAAPAAPAASAAAGEGSIPG